MTDYVNRQRQEYDAEAILVTAGAVTATFAAKAAPSNEVHVGENVLVEAVVQVRGAVANADNTLDLVVQESDAEGGTYAAVQGGAFPQLTDGDASGGTYRIQFRTTKPWVSIAGTIAGTTPSFGDTEVFIVGGAK